MHLLSLIHIRQFCSSLNKLTGCQPFKDDKSILRFQITDKVHQIRFFSIALCAVVLPFQIQDAPRFRTDFQILKSGKLAFGNQYFSNTNSGTSFTSSRAVFSISDVARFTRDRLPCGLPKYNS